MQPVFMPTESWLPAARSGGAGVRWTAVRSLLISLQGEPVRELVTVFPGHHSLQFLEKCHVLVIEHFPPLLFRFSSMTSRWLAKFSSVPSVGSELMNSQRGQALSVPSFSGRRWEGFSAWNFKKKEEFLHKGHGNGLLFRAEEKLGCPDPARDCPRSSLSTEATGQPATGTRPSRNPAAGLMISGSPALDRIFLGDHASEKIENNNKVAK